MSKVKKKLRLTNTFSNDIIWKKGDYMIYVIVGPTGVGKTKLSVMLAKKLNAIVLNADSMQVYKELNIGTAKIKEEEKEGIPHYLFDIKSINDEYNAYLYQNDGRKILEKFKNKDIIIVGGTGLYIKTLLYDYRFNNKGNINKPLYDFKIIGLTRNREKLYDIINNRVDLMIKEGLINEAKMLYDKKINSRVLKTAIGYKELFDYFNGTISLKEAIDKIKQNSRHYAKRQYTFFNNQFDNIVWYDVDIISFDEIVKKVTM